MPPKIQLQHPLGKKAISMEKDKYETLKNAVLNFLMAKGESTHTEILQSITEDFKKNKVKFAGSVEWHLEWIKLDMEAKKEIKRIGKSPIKFTML
ncbi:MAG: hypothetical protein A2046_10305 [Bacteroidetes bacterium GWA2_30_7]|nr:MAG: hypothetical protein A2046_10305 [Bacteroidetes bacterium GWA2_30_7]